ncbi:MAG TPA: hypothetical protein VEL07_04900 [Planctomycetota bacterium]|nr:hypothetical protein [Planctomycetota bacterium]
MEPRRRLPFEAVLERPAPERPWWQRVLLPIAGLACVVVGIIGWIMPVIPGAPLAVFGIPLLFCFSRTWEDRARVRTLAVMRWGQARWLAMRCRWRARHDRR